MPSTTAVQSMQSDLKNYFEKTKETLKSVIVGIDSCKTERDAKELEQKWKFLKIAFKECGFPFVVFANKILESEPQDSLAVSKLKKIGQPYLQKQGTKFSTNPISAGGFADAFDEVICGVILKAIYIEMYSSDDEKRRRELLKNALAFVIREELGMTFLYKTKQEARGYVQTEDNPLGHQGSQLNYGVYSQLPSERIPLSTPPQLQNRHFPVWQLAL